MDVEREQKADSSVTAYTSPPENERTGRHRSWWKLALAAALKVFIIQVIAPAVRRQTRAEEKIPQSEA